jgi:hypothetical protein
MGTNIPLPPRNLDTKGVDAQKVSVSAPNPPKLCLGIRLKRVDSLSRRLFPAFICFEYRLMLRLRLMSKSFSV